MWEGNGKEILNFFEWEANGKELIFFFRERRKKEGKNWEKCQKFAKNGPKIGKNSKFCIILHFS